LIDLPATAAWRLAGVHEGFETVLLRAEAGGYRLEGSSTGVEDGVAWGVRYELELDAAWATRAALVSALGGREVRLDGNGAGSWLVDGTAAPRLEGCLDVDLEISACTNAFPVRRLGLEPGDTADAPAAYVRADLLVERLEQRYKRLDARRYEYFSPASGFEAVLVYDDDGLVRDYPGVAVRIL
jgi:uncharacterized protein